MAGGFQIYFWRQPLRSDNAFNNYEAGQSLSLPAAGYKHPLLCYDAQFLAVLISYFPV